MGPYTALPFTTNADRSLTAGSFAQPMPRAGLTNRSGDRMRSSPSHEDVLPQRRMFPRYEVQCRARIRIGSRHYAGYIDNISIGGARLRTISPIRRLGDVVLRLPDLPVMQCKLRWTNAYHAGVSFTFSLPTPELANWAQSRSGSLADQFARYEVAELEELVP